MKRDFQINEEQFIALLEDAVTKVKTADDKINGRIPSDHYPVIAEMDWLNIKVSFKLPDEFIINSFRKFSFYEIQKFIS